MKNVTKKPKIRYSNMYRLYFSKVAVETEKGFLIEFCLEPTSQEVARKSVWLPKSKVHIEKEAITTGDNLKPGIANVPGWLVDENKLLGFEVKDGE